MVGWHHRLNGHEFEQTPGVGEGQGSPVRCGPWGHKESDTTERLKNGTPGRLAGEAQSGAGVTATTLKVKVKPQFGWGQGILLCGCSQSHPHCDHLERGAGQHPSSEV